MKLFACLEILGLSRLNIVNENKKNKCEKAAKERTRRDIILFLLED